MAKRLYWQGRLMIELLLSTQLGLGVRELDRTSRWGMIAKIWLLSPTGNDGGHGLILILRNGQDTKKIYLLINIS